MYLRFIRLVVREGSEAAFQTFYRERIIPALTAVPGCVFAGLLTPWRSDEHRSLTLWRSADAALAYEKSGLYHQLLGESMPYLSSRTVWRARLADDPLETLAPGADPANQREIPPEGYELAGADAEEKLGAAPRSVFVRVVAVQLATERREEFLARFRSLVIPALHATPGCLGALLAEGVRDRNEALSITLWDCETSATRYEMSGEFERLSRLVESTYAPMTHWQLVLGEGGIERRRAPEIGTYQLVLGRRLPKS